MSSRRSSIEDLIDLLKKNAWFLRHYPSCTYLVRVTLEKLRKAAEDLDQDEAGPAIRRFVKFMENDIWNYGSSTISSIIDVPTQKMFVNYCANFMSEMAHVLKDREYGRYLAIEEDWERSFNSFRKRVRTSSTRLRSVKGATLRLVGELRPWEIKFGELVNKYELVMEAENPIFLLKSGYRSIYFFNPSHLVSRSNVNVQKNQEIMNEFKEVLRMFIQYLKTEVGEENISVLLTQKIGGEDPGTVQFGPLFTELGVPPEYLDPYVDALKGPVRECNIALIPCDGVSTTLKTVKTITDRYRRIMKKKPKAFSLILNRSPYSSTNNIPILSTGPPLVLDPEILKISITTYDNDFGYWWPSLLLSHDYLKDIYLYSGKDINAYNKARREFEKLITDSYEISKGKRTTYLFTYFDTDLPFSKLATYLMNVHILCWNAILDISFNKKILRREDPVGYIESMLRFEKREQPTLSLYPAVLKKRLNDDANHFPMLIDPWDKIHRIFTEENETILKNIKNKYLQRQIGITKVRITLDEAYRIIDNAIMERREVYKQAGWDVDAEIRAEPKLREMMLRDLKELYEVVEG